VTKPEDFQFREVLEITTPDDAAYEDIQITEITPGDEVAYKAYEDQEIVLEYEIEEGDVLKVRLGPTRLTGDAIASAYAAVDSQGGYKIIFELTGEATPQFAALTQELVGKQLAIVLGYNLKSFPNVNEPITDGRGEITGDFTRDEARDLARVFKVASE
jgi:preprotein translocase subunit SecD